MLKSIPVALCLCLSVVSVQAQELSADEALQSEFELNKMKVEEIFQDKIQKISARSALPEDMRKLLISQADEIRQFDLNMLQKKMELKIKQAKKRDEIKEKLRQDAQNRAKWLLEDEEKFQKNKAKKETKEAAVLDDVKNIVKAIEQEKKDNLQNADKQSTEKKSENQPASEKDNQKDDAKKESGK